MPRVNVCVRDAAETQLQGSVSRLTLYIINENTTYNESAVVLTLAAGTIQTTVSDLQPDTVYSAVLTVTVHGGHNITSDAAITRTAVGGQLIVPYR